MKRKKPQSTFPEAKKTPIREYNYFIYDYKENLLEEGQLEVHTINEALNKAIGKACKIKQMKRVKVKVPGKDVERAAWVGLLSK